MSRISLLLDRVAGGDRLASEELFACVHDDLRQQAARFLSNERIDHTLTPTALINEAYLRLAGNQGRMPSFQSRRHFFGAAAQAMRRILVDYARKKNACRRPPVSERIPFNESVAIAPHRPDLIELDDALQALADEAPDIAELVTLRYFGGLTMEEAAESLGVSLRSAERNWRYAKVWLLDRLSDQS